MKRVVLIVLDGCGAGMAPDADIFGDVGEKAGDTLVHTAQAVGGLKIPNLRRLGLGNALNLAGGSPDPAPIGSYGRLTEKSLGGKDTVTGHWEMMGIISEKPFPTYPQGFPAEIIERFSQAIGSPILGNYASSGTVILKELGEQHLATGHPIVYTSADSVFQIACHEEKVPIERLYEICRSAREVLSGEYNVQRVIARPFEGTNADNFRRTERRQDFPLNPPENVLDGLAGAGVYVAGIGVVPEVFDNRGFTYRERTQTNEEHHQATMRQLAEHPHGFIFVNFEDFDMLYGHRNDPPGFAKALETFDGYLGEMLGVLTADDLLLITADHGNDPTTPSTDHTREYVPVLLYNSGRASQDYGIRPTFADLGATVAQVFGVKSPAGTSLL